MDLQTSKYNKTNLTGILCAIFSAIFMGTIGVFSKITGLTPEVITFFRLLMGAGFMFLYLCLTKKTHLLRIWPSWPVLLNGFFLAGFIIFYINAMNYTTMANAIMLVYLAPMAASVVAHFFLNEKLSKMGGALIVAAMAGFAMMMEFKIDFSTGTSHATGILLGTCSLFAYAGFILINRTIPEKIHVFSRTFYQLLIGGMVMVPLLSPQDLIISTTNWFWLTLTGLIPGFLGILFAVVALRQLPAATFGTLAYFEPIAVVIFGWTIFGETLSPLQMAGCAVILLSGLLKARTHEKNEY